MSAKYDADNHVFYISTDENFPNKCEKKFPPGSGYFSKLSIDENKTYVLTLKECLYCDVLSGHYSCGYNAKSREILAKIKHVCYNSFNSFYEGYFIIIIKF